MYLLKSLRTTSAPPSTLVALGGARGKTPRPERDRGGEKFWPENTAKHKKERYWPGNLCLLGRHEVPHSTVLFCAVSTKYLMIVFIFYRTPALSCPFLPAPRNRSVALFNSVACNKVWSLCATLWGFPARVVFLLKSVPFIKLMQYLGSMQSARLLTENEGECNLLRLLYVILVQSWYLSELPALI